MVHKYFERKAIRVDVGMKKRVLYEKANTLSCL